MADFLTDEDYARIRLAAENRKRNPVPMEPGLEAPMIDPTTLPLDLVGMGIPGMLKAGGAGLATLLGTMLMKGGTSKVANKQTGAILADPYYHGTNVDFLNHKEGLIPLTTSPETAFNYASGGGGQRAYKPAAVIVDEDRNKLYDVIDTPGEINRKIRELGNKDNPVFTYNPYTKNFDAKGHESLSTEGMAAISSGANIRRYAVDVEKPLDLSHKGYDRNGLPLNKDLQILAGLDPKGSRFAKQIIDSVKEGTFSWSDTKLEPFQNAWKDVLIPQLKAKGYDAIKYGDYGHDTLSVFDNKQLKQLSDVLLKTTDKTTQDTAIENLTKHLGVSFNKGKQ